MTRPRNQQISIEATPYYHCVSRCVRRAFLCGHDHHTDTSYEHRRGWLEEELIKQSQVFAIDIAAYAIMSNHYHVVLHINKPAADCWTLDEVIDRWHRLYQGNIFSQRYRMGEALSEAEQAKLKESVETWRERLSSISWFMRRLNETISRQANKEDGCTGRFWEGRFKSQALLDEKALAACLAYVDLNPIRANMAKTPETSSHTSVKQRCKQAKHAKSPNHPNQQAKLLFPFVGNPRKDMPTGLPFRLIDYLELLDWTGRVLRSDKRGAIDKNTPIILTRLGLEINNWLTISEKFEESFKGFVGSSKTLESVQHHFGLKRIPGKTACSKHF